MTPVLFEALELADGRQLEYVLTGDPYGFPLVMHHGTPGDASLFIDWNDACNSAGFRLICPGRPGYAESTRLPGRSVADMARDTDELLRALGIQNFVVAGWSGGGPHALACAARLPDACLGGALLAGVGPSTASDLDFLAGMGQENLDEFGAAYAGEETLRAWMDENGTSLRTVTGDAIAQALGDLVPDADREVLNGGFADRIAATFRRALNRNCDGWIDDDLAFIRPWGFELSSIKAPITIWQGDLDRMVPLAHGQWLGKNVPHSTLRLVPGHGHISLVVEYLATILDDLKTLSKRNQH